MPLRIFYLPAFTLLFFFQVQASHLITTDLHYRFISTQQNGHLLYEVTLSAYRDCFHSEVPFDDEVFLGIYSRDTASSQIADSIRLVRDFPIKLSSQTSKTNIPCIGSAECIEKATYTSTISLEPNTTGYFLFYTRCCKTLNSNLPMISGMSHSPLDRFAYIPPEGTQNSSAKLLNPIQFGCFNTEQAWSLATTDLDGDSVHLEISPIITANQTSLSQALLTTYPQVVSAPTLEAYAVNYSYLEPLGSGNNFQFDSTGTIRYSGPIGRYYIGITINEYRNSKLIASRNTEAFLILKDCSSAGSEYPRNLVAETNYSRFVFLQWEDCRNSNQRYIINRQKKDHSWLVIDSTLIAKTTYVDTDSLHPGETYIYRIDALDSSGQISGSTNTDTIVVTFPLGVNNIENQGFSIYPNPFNAYLVIEGGKNAEIVQIMSLSGDIIIENKIEHHKELKINVSSLQSGMYLIQITYTDGSTVRARVVKF